MDRPPGLLIWVLFTYFICVLVDSSGTERTPCSDEPDFAGLISNKTSENEFVSMCPGGNLFQWSGDVMIYGFCDREGFWKLPTDIESEEPACDSIAFTGCDDTPSPPEHASMDQIVLSDSNLGLVAVSHVCDEQFSWISGVDYRIQVCRDNQWQPLHDICINTAEDCQMPKDCSEVFIPRDGMRFISPSRDSASNLIQVECKTFDGDGSFSESSGWTVIARRHHLDDSEISENLFSDPGIFDSGGGSPYPGYLEDFFIGTNNLYSISTMEDGSVRPQTIMILIKGNNKRRYITYFDAIFNEDHTINITGQFHGNMSDCWDGPGSVSLFPEFAESECNLLGSIRFGEEESSDMDPLNVTIYIRPQEFDDELACPGLNLIDSHDETIDVAVPLRRSEGSIIRYACKHGPDWVDEITRENNGVTTCVMEDGVLKWAPATAFHCKITCEDDFQVSADASKCIYIPTDNVLSAPNGLLTAVHRCSQFSSSLLHIQEMADIEDIPEDDLYYYVNHVARQSDAVLNNVFHPGDFRCGGDICQHSHEARCLVVSRTNYTFTSCLEETNGIACRKPGLCPEGYTNYNGICYEVIENYGALSSLRTCEDNGSALAYPETVSHMENIIDLMSEENALMAFVGIHNVNNNWTFGGLYSPTDELISKLGQSSLGNWRILATSPPAITLPYSVSQTMLPDPNYGNTEISSSIGSFLSASYTSTQLASHAVCQYPGLEGCSGDPSHSGPNMAISTWDSVSRYTSTVVEYRCYPGYFLDGIITVSRTTATCLGQLGNWYPSGPLPECLAVDVCVDAYPALPTAGIVTSETDTSRHLNGTVTFTCPGGLALASGIPAQNITCKHDLQNSLYFFDPPHLQECFEFCWDEPEVVEATTDWNDSSLYRVEDNVTATCNEGYEVSYGQTVQAVQCLNGNSWESIPCYHACIDPPPDGSNQNLVTDTTPENTIGTVLNYTCSSGFFLPLSRELPELRNTTMVVCNDSGIWETEQPFECMRYCIGDPPEGDSSVRSNWAPYMRSPGTKVEYTCSQNGYLFPDGETLMFTICGMSGDWSQVDLEALYCMWGTNDEPVLPPYESLMGTLEPPTSPYFVGDTRTVTCDDGFRFPNGSTSIVLTFTEEGWTGYDPTYLCYEETNDSPILPPPPPLADSSNVTDAAGVPDPLQGTLDMPPSPYYVSVRINYTCPEGSSGPNGKTYHTFEYTPDGWTSLPSDFICYRVTYMVPTLPAGAYTHGHLIGASGPFAVGDIVYYSCNEDSINYDTGVKKIPLTFTPNGWTQIDPDDMCRRHPDAPPPPTTEPPPSYPDANVFEQAYDITTDVHMPSIEQFMVNADEDAPDFNLCTGPFGFGYAVSIKEEDSQCLKRSPYAVPGDCTQDPSTCTKGFSFSIWVRTNISMSVFYTAHKLHEDPKKYILSTGGDEFGHPGVAVYVQGLALVALVSTGDKYWKLQVLGPLVNDDWNNLGLRFVGTEDEQGGVELYLNANKIGHEHHSKPSAPRLDHFDPSEMLIGCHRDTDDMNYRGFITADFDEFASWNRRLPDDQVIFFMGGFEGEIENLSPEEFDVMIGKTDLSDPAQAEIGLAMLNAMADNLPGPDSGSSDTSNDTSTDQNENDGNGTVVLDEGALKLRGMADVIAKMTNPRLVKKDITLEEFDIFMKVVEIASKLLNESHADRWKLIAKDGHRSSRGVKDDIEHYVDALAKNMKMAPTNPEPEKFIKTTDNIVVKIDKMTITDYESLGEHYSAPNYRESDAMRKLWTEWDQPSDKVFVPTGIFSDPRCKDKPVSVVTFLYDSYDEVGPQNIAEEGMRHDVKNEIDSRVMRVNVVPDAPSVPRTSNSYHECRIDQRKMEKSWPSAKFENKLKVKTHRGLQFHQDENNSPIYRRICVWWNQLLGEIGAWDSDGCDPLAGNAYFSKCRCRYFGTYAVIAEHLEHRELPEEPEWSKTIKIIFHIISAICIIIYILFVAFAGDLKDQFHMSGAAFAACVLGGSIALLISDSHQIREDRHSCAAIGSLIHGFYLLASAWLANISHAGFKGVTRGIITGKMKAYIMLSFGITLMSLGTSYLFYIHDLGNDPRCFISWYDDVKMLFLFFPLMIFVLVAIFYAFVIFFNLRHAKKTSKVILTEYSSFILGSTFLTIYFTIVWILGAAAYIKIGKKDSGVLPYFQILNSLVGVVILLCLGLHSTKFRGVLSQTAQKKREQLQKYKENANQKGKKLKDPEGKKKKPSASKNPPPPPTNTGLDPPPAAQYIPPPEPPAAPPADLPSPPDVPSPPLDVGALSL